MHRTETRPDPDAAEKDRLECLALGVVTALVDVEPEVPGRARLVVVVAKGEDGSQAGEVDLAGAPVLDLPGEGAEALSLGRTAALALAHYREPTYLRFEVDAFGSTVFVAG